MYGRIVWGQRSEYQKPIEPEVVLLFAGCGGPSKTVSFNAVAFPDVNHSARPAPLVLADRVW